jgi:hypothetical protein
MKKFEVEFGYKQNGIRQYKTLSCEASNKKKAIEKFVSMMNNPKYFSLSNENVSFSTEKVRRITDETD